MTTSHGNVYRDMEKLSLEVYKTMVAETFGEWDVPPNVWYFMIGAFVPW